VEVRREGGETNGEKRGVGVRTCDTYIYTYILFASIPVIISTRAEETPTRGGKKKQHNTYSVSSSQATVQTLTTLLLTLYKRKKEKKTEQNVFCE